MNTHSQKTVSISSGKANLETTIYSDSLEETIILLHGGPGVPDDMPEVVDLLKDRFRVITFIQRGIGNEKCKGCSYEMDAYISDLDAIAEFLKIDSFHLFGHSWGGLYAQIYAENRPNRIKSLFLCSSGSGTGDEWKITEREVLEHNKSKTNTREWLGMGINSLFGMLGSSKSYRKLMHQVLTNYNKDYGNVVINDSLLNLIQADPLNKTKKALLNYKRLDTLENPNFPVVITYGDDDIYGDSKNFVLERYPTAKVSIISNSGHIPWKHNLSQFSEIVTAAYSLESN